MRYRLLATAVILSTALHAVAEETRTGIDPEAVATGIVEQTNALRRQQNERPLAPAAELEAAARYYAGHMADTDTYGHTADGNEPAERAAAHGYEFCIVAENVAYSRRESGYDDEALVRDLMQGWIESAGHRRNMLDSAVTEIGVAVAHSAQSDRYYAVQMFGLPERESIAFSIANESRREVRYRMAGSEFALAPGMTRMHRECRARDIELRLPRGARPRSHALEARDGAAIVVEERPEGWQVSSR